MKTHNKQNQQQQTRCAQHRKNKRIHARENYSNLIAPGGYCHWRLYQMREKENTEKGYVFQGWTRNAQIVKRVSKSQKMGEKGIQIIMIRVITLQLYVER